MTTGSIMETSPRRRFLVDVDKFEKFLTTEGCLSVCEIKQHYLIFKNGRAACLKETHWKRFASTTVRTGETPFDLDEFEFRAHEDEYMGKRGLKTGQEIKRTQWEVDFNDQEWTVDIFHFGDDDDEEDDQNVLSLASFEGPSVASTTAIPEWATTDVTDDIRYRSASMAINGRPE
jgi:CYTH domain-containing protein